MCEVFGYSSAREEQLNTYLQAFFEHSRCHPHGWGMACIDRGWMEKESVKASDSEKLKQLLQENIASGSFQAHIRYATVGDVDPENCHPFSAKDNSGRRWTLIHNGTIFNGPQLEQYFKHQGGNTDSERILLHIVECMNEVVKMKERPLTDGARFQIINGIICALAPQNKLNLLIHDGQLLYAHTNMAHSLHIKQEAECVLIATTPLDERGWKPVPFMRTVAFHKGHCAFQGTMHRHEYFPKPEELALLYQIYSGL